MRFLRKLEILACVVHIRFVQNRIHRMRQRLINAAPGHDVAAEKKTHYERVSLKCQVQSYSKSDARTRAHSKSSAKREYAFSHISHEVLLECGESSHGF